MKYIACLLHSLYYTHTLVTCITDNGRHVISEEECSIVLTMVKRKHSLLSTLDPAYGSSLSCGSVFIVSEEQLLLLIVFTQIRQKLSTLATSHR